MSNYKLFLIQVDIYGKCGPLSCPRKDEEWAQAAECVYVVTVEEGLQA